MTSDDFIQRLRLRHPTKAGSVEAILSDIKQFLVSIPPQRIEHLWEHYIKTYERDPMPRRAHMEKMAKEAGIGRAQSERMAYRCKDCGTVYPMRSKGCPVCRTQQHDAQMIMYSTLPKESVRVQEDCWCCELYSEFAIGPVCKTFGRMPEDPAVCLSCECRQCCHDERIYRSDKNLYQELASAGKLFDPKNPKKR